MPEETFVRVTKAARLFNVDPQTMRRSLIRAGYRLHLVGVRCYRLRAEDFERLKKEGLPYYNDKIPCKK